MTRADHPDHQTWSRSFDAVPASAREVRAWVDERLSGRGRDPWDAVFVANELFVAVLRAEEFHSGRGRIVMTLSTAGRRVRVYAGATLALPVNVTHGPWRQIAGAVALARGDDRNRSIWAELLFVQPESGTGYAGGAAAPGGTP